MKTDSPAYTLLFTAAVCVACSLLVAGSNVLLRDRQEENRRLYLQRNVLQASGLVPPGQAVPDREAREIFRGRVEPKLVDLASGEYVSGMDPQRYDQRRARGDPAQSRAAVPNPASVRRVPNVALVYLVSGEGGTRQVVIPVEGLGLYGTLYGFLALERDTTTIRGLSFYENRETPGLGGEVDNAKWKSLWAGRKAYDENWRPRITLVKGQAGLPERDPYHVDALAGATMTSNGVSRLLQFWLGEQGFGPYLRKLRERGGP
jgi:Na+-transporting NADH:ubiquinone oxidoreductase subunit C